MFVETSAFVALLAGEPDQERIAAAIDGSAGAVTSSVVRLEAVMVLSRELGVSPDAAQKAFDKLLDAAHIEVLAFTDEMARNAVMAFSNYGKGPGNKAQLNLGDCLVYGAAKSRNLPVLFIGNDFTHTDIVSVLTDPSPLSAS